MVDYSNLIWASNLTEANHKILQLIQNKTPTKINDPQLLVQYNTYRAPTP